MSHKYKLSQWHDGSIKPVHIGVYEVATSYEENKWSYFDGSVFNGAWETRQYAEFWYKFGHGLHIFKWRGIVK